MNWNKNKELYKGILAMVTTLLIWEFFVRFGFLPEIFTSKPSKIYIEGIKIIKTGSIFSDIGVSLKVFVAGFFSAVFCGVTIGMFLGFYKNVLSFVKAHIFILGSLPMMALFPLITMWVGIGYSARIVFIFLMALVPILINTIDGVKNVKKESILMANSFGAKNFFILRTVVFFDALPFIFSGIRSAVGRGITGLIISEFFGYGKGLGHLISYYGNTMQTARYMFVLVIVSALSLTVVKIVGMLEKRIIFWNKK